MIVRYLDLKTGRKAEENGITEFNLIEGNWSCDCNRGNSFPDVGVSISGTCKGCQRFIVYDVESEKGDPKFDAQQIMRDANREYYQLILTSHSIG